MGPEVMRHQGSPALHFSSSLVAAAAACVCMQPFDLVGSRIMNQVTAAAAAAASGGSGLGGGSDDDSRVGVKMANGG
jgi:hypothetical protein